MHMTQYMVQELEFLSTLKIRRILLYCTHVKDFSKDLDQLLSNKIISKNVCYN